ncbi:MAG: hypothetical protein IT423_20045 [Pirellulaceae bacterium]|nr:hypothetical protein [Pirellulaceae bacterium]
MPLSFTPKLRRKLALERLDARLPMAGDLDPTFADFGVLADPIPGVGDPADWVQQLATDQQGRVLMLTAGSPFETGRTTVNVLRLTPNGTLDSSFDFDGQVSLALPGGIELARDFAIQGDKIVVLTTAKRYSLIDGVTYNLIRLNSNGSLDKSFGSQGIAGGVTGTFAQYEVRRVVVGKSNELYVLADRAHDAVVVTKYFANGTLDTSYGTGGSVAIAADTALAQDLVVMADGSLLAAFSSRHNSDYYELVVTRVKTDGTLDDQFAVGGRHTAAISNNQLYSLYGRVRMGLDSAENIYVAAMRRTDFAQDFFVQRLSRSGVLDQDYGTAGEAMIVSGDEWGTLLQGLVVTTTGQVHLSGTLGFQRRPFIALIDPDGNVDKSRSSNGLNLYSTVHGNEDGLGGLVPLPGGRFITSISHMTAGKMDAYGVDQYGQLDGSFGNSGAITLNPTAIRGDAQATGILQVADGKLLGMTLNFAGKIENSLSTSQLILTRYLPNGTLDTTYGTNGRLLFDAGIYSQRIAKPFFEHAGFQYLAINFGTTHLKIARLTSQGELDANFGTAGWITWAYPKGPTIVNDIDAVVAVDDGFIFSSSNSFVAGRGQYVIGKLDQTGQLVTNFGNNGLIVLEQNSAAGTKSDLAAWDDNSFAVMLAHVKGDTPFTTTARKYTSAGVLDSTFANQGILTLDLSPDSSGMERQLTLRNDGRMVLFGSSLSFNGNLMVSQYLANGQIDPAFGNGTGRTQLPKQATLEWPQAVLVDSQDRVVMLSVSRATNNENFFLNRLLPTGAVDPDFGILGRKELSLSPHDDYMNSLSQTEAGDLLLAGKRLTATAIEPVFVRLLEKNPAWHNGRMRTDVNTDTLLSPIDALLVINWLNSSSGSALPDTRPDGSPLVDVNGDQNCTALDALLIINELNRLAAGEGEAEPGFAGDVLDVSIIAMADGVDPASEVLATGTTASPMLMDHDLLEWLAVRRHRVVSR